MGFLEQEAEEKRRLAQEEAAKAEHNRLRAAQEAAALLKVEEDLSYASEDNQRIAELLDNLPKFDLREYLKIVERLSGYTSELCLYTRASNVQITDVLENKLSKLGVVPKWDEWETPAAADYAVLNRRMIRTVHPNYMFCGIGVYPTKGFLGLTPITEPQESGIGLNFAKDIKTTFAGKTKTIYGELMETYETVTNHVFVRFVFPSRAIITGNGVRVDVTDLNTFDDALKHGFKYPHKSITIRSTPVFTGGVTG